MRAGAMLRLRGQRIFSITHGFLLACATIALIYLASRILFAFFNGGLAAHSKFEPAIIWLGATIYIIGHGLRSLRLALLIGGWRIGLRLVVSFHFLTAAVSLAVPLKLGEVYRVTELSYVMRDFIRAVETIWWERVFDVLAIIIIMLIVLFSVSKSDWQQFVSVAILAVAFVIVTALTFFVLPDNLRRLSVLIIRRYDSPRSVPLLRMIDRVRRAIYGAPRLVRAKVASLLALTALIWACEMTCFAIVLGAVGGTLSSAPDALLRFLSVVTRGYTLLGALQSSQEVSDVTVLTYLTITQIPLVFVGLVLGSYYIGQQVTWRR
jgi:hypothetical protein